MSGDSASLGLKLSGGRDTTTVSLYHDTRSSAALHLCRASLCMLVPLVPHPPKRTPEPGFSNIAVGTCKWAASGRQQWIRMFGSRPCLGLLVAHESLQQPKESSSPARCSLQKLGSPSLACPVIWQFGGRSFTSCLTGMHLGGGFLFVWPDWRRPLSSHPHGPPLPLPVPAEHARGAAWVLDDRQRPQSSLASSDHQGEQVLSPPAQQLSSRRASFSKSPSLPHPPVSIIMRTHQMLGPCRGPRGSSAKVAWAAGAAWHLTQIFRLLFVPGEFITTSPQSGGGPEREDRNFAPCRLLVVLALGPSPTLCCCCPWSCVGVQVVGSAKYLKIGCPRFEQE